MTNHLRLASLEEVEPAMRLVAGMCSVEMDIKKRYEEDGRRRHFIDMMERIWEWGFEQCKHRNYWDEEWDKPIQMQRFFITSAAGFEEYVMACGRLEHIRKVVKERCCENELGAGREWLAGELAILDDEERRIEDEMDRLIKEREQWEKCADRLVVSLNGLGKRYEKKYGRPEYLGPGQDREEKGLRRRAKALMLGNLDWQKRLILLQKGRFERAALQLYLSKEIGEVGMEVPPFGNKRLIDAGMEFWKKYTWERS